MSLNIKIELPEEPDAGVCVCEDSVTNEPLCVSKSSLDLIAAKVLNILEIQGVACSKCGKSQYKLYPLSDDCQSASEGSTAKRPLRFRMEIFCAENTPIYTFELTMKGKGGIDHE